MDFIEYKTLTVGYEGFIFDYTVDMGGSVQIYHDNGEFKDFIDSVEIPRELENIDGLKGFAVGWYIANIDEEKTKRIYTDDDGNLTISVGSCLKFKQVTIKIDEYDTHNEILVYRIEEDGNENYLDSLQTVDKVNYDVMLLLVEEWLEHN